MGAQGTDDTAPAAQRAPGPTQPSLKARALRLLAGREHSRAELERKLAAHEQASQVVPGAGLLGQRTR